jgi:hypothetical protein
MFVKLNKNIVVKSYTQLEEVVNYSKTIKYYKVKVDEFDVFNIIPEKYRSKFSLLLMRVTGMILPHTDSGILCTINVYTKPDNCITNFYNFKSNQNIKEFKIQNQTNGSLYNRAQLDLFGSFSAAEDEVWLLDVTKPHSVNSNSKNLIPNTVREAIVLQSRYYNYDEVSEMLKETGYL